MNTLAHSIYGMLVHSDLIEQCISVHTTIRTKYLSPVAVSDSDHQQASHCVLQTVQTVALETFADNIGRATIKDISA